MRLYHMILVLSALIVTINVGSQAVGLRGFSHVRDTVEVFGENWLPTVRLTGELGRLGSEFRRLELRYVLAGTETEMASIARSMGRQRDRIRHAEERLDSLLQTEAERKSFQDYLRLKADYVAENRAILEEMVAGRKAEAALLTRSSAQYFSAMSMDLQTIERINHELGQAAGLEAQRRYDQAFRAMLLAAGAGIVLMAAASILAARLISRPISGLATHMVTREGAEPTPAVLRPPRLASTEVVFLYRSFRTLTKKLARSRSKLEAMSVTDQLTGVANRRRLMDEGTKDLDICRRGGKGLSVLMLDLDHFKSVNDTHGHAAGDAVLESVARELAAHVRASDLLARYGGEEFAVVAPNSGKEDVLMLAERLRLAVQGLIVDAHGVPLKVTVSIGAASDGPDVRDLGHLLDMADKSLYQAKKNGRNRVECLPRAA